MRGDYRYGRFGENFTVKGLLEESVGVGDRFAVGSAVVEVTQPRMPCFKLGIRVNDPGFPKRFMQSGRTGFYMRVIEPGDVGEGDQLERTATGTSGFTVSDIWSFGLGTRGTRDELQRALEISTLGPEWRKRLEGRVEKI